jgi:hypothetical protein
MSLIKPSDILDTANDIVAFAKRDDLSDIDRKKILEMCRDYYNDKNDHIVDQWLSQLLSRTIDKHFPQTDFEKDE